MLKDILRLSFLSLLLIAIAGCEVSDPGSAIPNQPPITHLVLAPTDSTEFNHFTHLKWSGTDPDGDISGFWILVDAETLMFTTAFEDTIAFYAPGDTTVPHRVQVTAVDNEGLVDPSPPSRFFYATNTRPTLAFASGSLEDGAVTGRGFAIELDGEDPNPSSLYYSIAVDDSLAGWQPWSMHSTFLFCDKSLDFLPCTTQTWRNVPCTAALIDKNTLTAGEHTIYARVKDAGEALGIGMISVNFTVVEGIRPAMDTIVTGVYGADDFYLDGSVFYRTNRETQITFSATPGGEGQINAYRYHLGAGTFTSADPWQQAAEIVMLNAPAGEYTYQIMARDVAGEPSDTITYSIYILEPEFTNNILIVDETRDGTGNPGSPDDEQVDNFYANIMGTRPFSEVDYATHQVGGVSYLSPLDVYQSGLIIYHTDDRANYNLEATRGILAEYMDRGGKVIFSGWNLLEPFGIAGPDSGYYSATGAEPARFAYNYLRLFYANRAAGREAAGITGVGGYPDIMIDPTKVPSSWNATVDKCWTFNNRGETFTTGTFDAADDESRYQGRHCAHVYLGPTYSVAVFGIPLYFCDETQAGAFMDQLLMEMFP